MKGPAYRVFKDGCPHHVYSRGINGNVVFYSLEDCVCYFTLYSHLARKYRIIVRAFTIMPNHVHSNEESDGVASFRAFHRDLNAFFTAEYNNAHDRSGPIFESPFGYSPKTVGKKIRDNLCYIANNPVIGKLSDDILGYRWSLLAYHDNCFPFSEKIVLRHASRPLRRSVKLVNYFRSKDLPLIYCRLEQVFRALDNKERNQIMDYIIATYNCLGYKAMTAFYDSSFSKACESFRANSGSEHDIPEDYENYKVYAQMIRLASSVGVDLVHCNFETTGQQHRRKIVSLFHEYRFPERQIDRFLHREARGG